jgi:hypothetical protein
LFGGFDFGLGTELLFGVGERGERILVVREIGDLHENPKLMLVQNWYAEFENN